MNTRSKTKTKYIKLTLNLKVEEFINACALGQISTVIDYLQKGFNINTTDEYGNTGLMAAASEKQEEIVVILIHRKANIHIKNGFGNTALTMACDKGNYSIAKLLIDHGSDVNQQDLGLNTILMTACFNSNLLIVELLLENGANPHLKNKEGKTAVDFVSFGNIKKLFTTEVRRCKVLNRVDEKGIYHKYFADKKYFVKDIESKFDVPVIDFINKPETVILMTSSKNERGEIVFGTVFGYTRDYLKNRVKVSPLNDNIVVFPEGQLVHKDELEKFSYYDFTFYYLLPEDNTEFHFVKCYSFHNFREIFG